MKTVIVDNTFKVLSGQVRERELPRWYRQAYVMLTKGANSKGTLNNREQSGGILSNEKTDVKYTLTSIYASVSGHQWGLQSRTASLGAPEGLLEIVH